MFSTPYSTSPQVQAYVVRAHRLRSAVFARVIRDVGRWISHAAR